MYIVDLIDEDELNKRLLYDVCAIRLFQIILSFYYDVVVVVVVFFFFIPAIRLHYNNILI